MGFLLLSIAEERTRIGGCEFFFLNSNQTTLHGRESKIKNYWVKQDKVANFQTVIIYLIKWEYI